MLTTERIDAIWQNYPCRLSKYELSDAIAEAATAPLLARIADLEQRNADLYADVQRFKEHALNEKDARMALERELAEASKDAERLDWLEKRLTGASDSGRYLPFRVYWGDGRGIRKAIDAAMSPPEQPK